MEKLFFKGIVIAALTISFVGTSCKKNDDNDSSSISGTISGEHADWDEISVSFDDGYSSAKTASISNGKFSLKLPTPNSNDLELMDDFEEGVNISDRSAKGIFAGIYVKKGSQKAELLLCNITLVPIKSITQVTYIYVDKNVNITGTDSDTEDGVTYTQTINLKLSKGWNPVIYSATESSSGNVTINIKTGSVPSNLYWMVVDENPYSLDNRFPSRLIRTTP